MKKFIPILKRTQLFAAVSEEEISSMLSCLNARLRTYKKGEYICVVEKNINRPNKDVANAITTLEGKIATEKEDFNKNRSKGTLSWQSVAKYYDCTSWLKLINILDLPIYVDQKQHPTIKVNIIKKDKIFLFIIYFFFLRSYRIEY